MNMPKRNIILLVIAFLVDLIWNVNGLLEFSKSLQDLYKIRTVQGVSIATCKLECESRQRCKSAIYYRDAHHCILTSKDTLANSTVVSKGAVLLSDFHSSMAQTGSFSNCGGRTCLPQETCITKSQGNISNQVCEITECPNPRGLLPNGTTVKGNIYTIDSKILVKCGEQNMTTIYCGSDGQWTNTSSSAVPDFAALNVGVYEICPNHRVDSNQGDWIVFQRRVDGSVDFYRNWTEYRNGFGDSQGEFWLGLEALYNIVRNGSYELRIDMENFNNETRFANYSTFSIGDETSKYTLTVSGYSGDAEDCFTSESGNRFSTVDEDNDDSSTWDIASYLGAWWYKNWHDYYANLNGLYMNTGSPDNDRTHMHWPLWPFGSYALRKSEMKIRLKQDG